MTENETPEHTVRLRVCFQVKLTKGDYTNLKLTTPEDLVIASQILETRRIEQGGARALKDDEYEDHEERLSETRANGEWAKEPRKIGVSEKEEVLSISLERANAKWAETPKGVAPPKEGEVEVKLDMSKLRANAAKPTEKPIKKPEKKSVKKTHQKLGAKKPELKS